LSYPSSLCSQLRMEELICKFSLSSIKFILECVELP
jgi:hypothetical protein